MKKILIPTLCVLIWMLTCLFTITHAQTWFPADKVTMAWDAPTEYTNGTPIPPDVTVYYYAYTKKPDQSNIARQTPDPITETQYTYQLSTEGKFFMGVSAVRIVDNENFESGISWSDVSENCLNGETFGVTFVYLFSNPLRLRKQ